MNPLDTVFVLAEEIGPRPSTSANERRAAEWIAARLSDLGFKTRTEPFRAVASFSYAYGIFLGLFVLAAIVYPTSPLAALALCALSLVLFGLEASSIETVNRVLPRGTSQNVIGTLEPHGTHRRTLVLTAHVDSARSALLWHPRLVPYFHLIFLLIAAAMLIETGLYALGTLTGATWVWVVSLAPAALLVLAVLIFIDREMRYTHTRGANDDASGVAVMLALAERLAHERLAETQVWVVATGCEETGPFGILRLLQAHSFDRANTYFLNFDNMGSGRLSYVTGEGILFTLPADAHLVALAREVAQAHPAIGAQPFVFKTLPTDNTVTLSKGYRGMSLMAFDPRGVLPHWHWRTDTLANVDAGLLNCATVFAEELARRVDREQ